jgi:hypothetical protein
VFHWPLFCVLAALHLTLLPAVLSEPGDEALSYAAGLLYLGLAGLDRWAAVRDRAGAERT